MELVVRTMVGADVDGLVEIERMAYRKELSEGRTVFEDRLPLSPPCCWVAESGGAVAGYLLSNPWRRGDAPLLGRPLGPLPDRPDCHFIHDLSVHPRARGLGVGRALVETVIRVALERGHRSICGVAVQGSVPFWESFGFRAWRSLPPALAEKLASYGGDAAYMERDDADPAARTREA